MIAACHDARYQVPKGKQVMAIDPQVLQTL